MLMFERTKSGFSFHSVSLGPPDVGWRRLPRVTPDLLWSLESKSATGFFRLPVYRRNVIGIDGASCSLRFHSSRVASVFVVDLYVGIPPLFPGSGRVGTSPVKLTNHFPEANPPTTLTLERRLPVFASVRRSMRLRSSCFTISRKLALRLGRIVNPPQVLFPGSFDTTV